MRDHVEPDIESRWDGTDLTVSLTVAAGLDRVWELLSTAEGRAAWFGTEATIDLVVGGDATVGWGGPEDIVATVDAVEPRRRLRLAYVQDGVEMGAEEYVLTSEDGHTTHVRLLQSMPAMPPHDPDDEDPWHGYHGDLERGWRLFLASLGYAATRDHPHRTATSTYTPAPRPRPAVWAEVVAALGLDDDGRPTATSPAGLNDVRLRSSPHSLLLTGEDRSLLIDLEGTGEHMVVYRQAATHAPETPALAAWRRDALAALD